MNISVIDTGSKGNSYALDDVKEILLLDAGKPLIDVKRAIDYQISRVVGCLVTHSHGDHAKYAEEYRHAGIRVWKPYEKEDVKPRQFGNYTVHTFDLVHDVPCYGFLINHSTYGRILYATDTEFIRYRFADLRFIIVECNYMDSMLDKDLDNTPKRDHVLMGHLELETVKRFLQANDNENLEGVLLVHLSCENMSADEAVCKLSPVISAPVWIAQKGSVFCC